MKVSTVGVQAEQRAYRRVSDAIALVIVRCDEVTDDCDAFAEAPVHPTHVVSLSPNGMRFYHHEPYAAGEELNLSIRLFPGGDALQVKGEVMNSGEKPAATRTLRYFTGIAFRDVSDDAHGTLTRHLEAVASKAFSGAVKLIN